MFMKEAYRVALIVFLITETMMSVLHLRSITDIDHVYFRTSQYAIEAYRNKSTIYDCIPGGALVGFTMKMLHSPLGALIATIQGGAMGYVVIRFRSIDIPSRLLIPFVRFIYGLVQNFGSRIIDRTYEDLHYEQVMNWILYRE
jgi:hypothetical protein